MNANNNIKYLLDTGYEFDDILCRYWFMYIDGSYRAATSVTLDEVLTMPLGYIQRRHEEFLELAEQKKEF